MVGQWKTLNMMLVYIHGASATSESFTYIRSCIGGNDIAFEYKSSKGFKQNFKTMCSSIKDINDDVFFIAHSLGGIYALHLANEFKEKTCGAVTLSTPYGGCHEADIARYFLPFNQLMRDIGTLSAPMSAVKSISLPAPWTQVVTTAGQSPWITVENDGVVTIESQRARPDMELIELPLNHYEVVLSNKTIEIIQNRIMSS